ncbi:MAG: hypothetical protein JOZ27_07700 [Caulobacteraceae bacterium]|nr:hypothetical protein [Caulobacteraceae bacterium]
MNFEHFLGLYLEQRMDPVIVCNLESEVAQAIGARVTRVWLSRDTLDKQKVRHPDLRPEDYRALKPALLLGEVRLESPKSAIVLYVDTRLLDWGLRVHLKATVNGREIYTDSFCRLRRSAYRRELAKAYPVVRAHK